MVDETAARTLLGQCWSSLGGDRDAVDRVTLTRAAPGLLPSRLHALPAMVAAVSASTLAAELLDARRAQTRPTEVVIDVEHVALAARSERYARRDGTDSPELFADLSRFWLASDGWLRMHANYLWHRQRALTVLGVPADRVAVAEAISSWRAVDLEDALADAGALGFVVRSPEQWRDHPQGRAVAALPLVLHAEQPGPARPLPQARYADGVRVLDLTRVIAGPVATRTLAAWGADVLRLDSPHLPELPAQALDTLPGKRSATLDLATAEGRDRLEHLLAEADVLVQGYRPGALARFGLDPQALAESHPHLTVVTLSAWGPAGPWSSRRGFDSLVQCPSGIAHIEAADGSPGALPAQVLDHATGYLAAAGALLSLAGVAHGERPRSLQLSLAQTAHWLQRSGPAVVAPTREPVPDRHLLTLVGARSPVQVIAPPGRTSRRTPSWSRTTELGADLAEFGSPPDW